MAKIRTSENLWKQEISDLFRMISLTVEEMTPLLPRLDTYGNRRDISTRMKVVLKSFIADIESGTNALDAINKIESFGNIHLEDVDTSDFLTVAREIDRKMDVKSDYPSMKSPSYYNEWTKDQERLEKILLSADIHDDDASAIRNIVKRTAEIATSDATDSYESSKRTY